MVRLLSTVQDIGIVLLVFRWPRVKVFPCGYYQSAKSNAHQLNINIILTYRLLVYQSDNMKSSGLTIFNVEI